MDAPLVREAVIPRPISEEWKPHCEAAALRRPSAPTLSTTTSRPSSPRKRVAAPHVSTAITAGFVTHMTPPTTPIESPGMDEINFNPSLFHNYLRAIHAFDPTMSSMSAQDASLSTVSIKPGNLILIHCIHANGWADGTVLNTGVRGWLPTNYCEAYDHPHLRNLLNAMTQFWDLLGAGENASLSTFVRQDYIRGLIAGVRYLLERADCLHRDAPTVKHHAGVRRMRKGLLADLSSLVQIAKRLQDTIGESFAGEVIHVLLDDLISKACKVVIRAVAFTDVWSQETSTSYTHARRQSHTDTVLKAIYIPKPSRRSIVPAIDSAVFIPSDDKLAEADAPATVDPPAAASPDRVPRRSNLSIPPDGMAVHRLSLIKKEKPGTSSGLLASEQLAQMHDVCISHIGAFIGHHLHARPTSELVATTERLVKACRDMLEIVDEVYAHDPHCSMPGRQVKKNFEAKLEELARSTQAVFRFSDSPDDDVVMLPDQTQHLIEVGTGLIRNSGECVAKTRQLIEQIGDFALKSSIASHPVQRQLPPTQGQALPGAPTDDSVKEPDVTELPLRSPRDAPAEPTDEQASTESTILLPPCPLPPRRQSLKPETRPLSVCVPDSNPGTWVVPHGPITPARKDSVGVSVAGSAETFHSSLRDSDGTVLSQISTRATTPDQSKDASYHDAPMTSSFLSLSSMHSNLTDDGLENEDRLLQKTFAHELLFNKDGQVAGGSLFALVEQLTTHDVAPCPQFVSAFFITFRKFTEPREFAQALIHRFDYVGESRTTGAPARLRIYNVFKGWLETYWNVETDKDALGDIRFFAVHRLKTVLPAAGDRLIELTRRITESYASGGVDGPLVSGVGKSSMSVANGKDSSVPSPSVTARQLNALRLANSGGAQCSILDLDPKEVARQISIMMMDTYCEIRPDELLSLEWGQNGTKRAANIRKMCLLNTDIANLIGDTILMPEDAKKRATIIKQWSKIGMSCLELNNYDTVMAITCAINSSVVQRLKRTWELVSKKTKSRLEELEQVVDMAKNYTALRKRLEAPTAPSLPFLGVFLTDITFVIAGNPKRRELPGTVSESGRVLSVINFDMYMRMARIVSHLQRFQVPYNLKPVPEMQTWIESHLRRMREGHDNMVTSFHRRSLFVEPKDERRLQSMMVPEDGQASCRPSEDQPLPPPPTPTLSLTPAISAPSRDRYHFFKSASFTMRSTTLPITPDQLSPPELLKRASAV